MPTLFPPSKRMRRCIILLHLALRSCTEAFRYALGIMGCSSTTEIAGDFLECALLKGTLGGRHGFLESGDLEFAGFNEGADIETAGFELGDVGLCDYCAGVDYACAFAVVGSGGCGVERPFSGVGYGGGGCGLRWWSRWFPRMWWNCWIHFRVVLRCGEGEVEVEVRV